MRVANKDMGAFHVYAFSTAGWLGLQSGILVLFPKLITSLLTEIEGHHTSDLELYFARSLGFALATLSLVVLFFTGIVPIGSVAESITVENNDPRAPYAGPILVVTTLFHALSTIYCYTRYSNSGQTGYVLGSLAYGALACFGGWCSMFGFSSRVSARTGQDKRTSGFLFPNTSAYDKKTDKKAR